MVLKEVFRQPRVAAPAKVSFATRWPAHSVGRGRAVVVLAGKRLRFFEPQGSSDSPLTPEKQSTSCVFGGVLGRSRLVLAVGLEEATQRSGERSAENTHGLGPLAESEMRLALRPRPRSWPARPSRANRALAFTLRWRKGFKRSMRK